MIINNSTPFPIFKKGQQLKSSSLTGIVNFAKSEIMDTRMYLEGAGIFYGLEVTIDQQNGAIRLSPGAAVTSDGKLFSLEKEIIFRSVSDVQIPLLTKTPTVGLLSTGEENHNKLVYRITGVDPDNPNGTPDARTYLIFLVMTEKTASEDSCLYGQDVSETSQTNTVQAVLVDKNDIDPNELKKWMISISSNTLGDDPFINRFGYTEENNKPLISFAGFTDWGKVSDGFEAVCKAAEPLIATSFKMMYDQVKDKLGLDPVNPFTGVGNVLETLRAYVEKGGGILYPWLYDYYRDLIAAYQELVSTDLFSYLSYLPAKDRFEQYISLGSIRGEQGVKYRMGLYRPPFADLSVNALQKPKQLIERLVYLVDTAHTRFQDTTGFPPTTVGFTPDAGINRELSKRAIPFYYKDPATLAESWSAELTRSGRHSTIPGIKDDRDRSYLLANMDGYEFFRIKGHTGALIDPTMDAIEAQRRELHLPFDIKVLYLGAKDDMTQLIKERSATFSDLTVILEKIVNDIRCARTCSDEFEIRIFRRKFDRNDIGSMFEALVLLFDGTKDLDEKLSELCDSDNFCFDEDKTCCRSHLTSLYAVCVEYVRRKEELAGNLLFHLFAEKHPGIEHNGGVPKGGTLILVCGKTDPAFLSEEKKSSLVKLMLSDQAAGISMVEELGNYQVLADFCLPYTCCSDRPSINLVLQEAPPVALFSIEEQTHLPEGQGTAVVLKNESLRADTYRWTLKDYEGTVLKETDTSDINEPGKFELLVENGVVFTITLTASREGMSSKYAIEMTICPQGKVQVTSNGKPVVDWDVSQQSELGIEAFPYGGSFAMVLKQNDNEQELDPTEYDINWKEDKEHLTLAIKQPQTGLYQLRYTFEDIEDCEKGFAILDIHTRVSTAPQPVPVNRDVSPSPATGHGPAGSTVDAAVFNKRILSYRSGVNAMSKEDDSLLADSRWADTKAFLLAGGAPEDLHTAYEKLQATLQTGFTKLKVAQKTQVIKLLIYATAYYIDRLVVASPDKVPAIAKKLIKAAGESVGAQKDGAQQWAQIWTDAGIITQENEKTVAAYKGLIA